MTRGKPMERAPRRRPQEDRFAARSDAAGRALRALVRDYFIEHFGPAVAPERLDLDLKLRVEPGDDWALHFDPPLAQQLLPMLQAAEAAQAVYTHGSVYCFRCESGGCDHARPGGCREIFAGYDQLGCPQWREFSQYLIDQGDEAIDRLYGAQRGLVVRHVRGRDLRERQLASFGKASKTYALLGQLVAGYFPLPQHGPEDDDQLAVSFQAVEVRDRQGRTCLELNTLYRLPPHLEFGELPEEDFAWVRRARDAAKAACDKVTAQLHLGKDGRNPLKAVPEILRRLALDLEQGLRRSRRQTRHARDRKELNRPVDKAMADLRDARPERMYMDAHTKAVVVCADKGRCHIFSEAGRHVTSFVIDMEAVRRRLKKRRWTELAPERRLRFMENIAHSA